MTTGRAGPLDAVLLVAFGGPENPEDVRPFLANVLAGRAVPPARIEAVVAHYAAIGGRSPLNALTFQQAEALQERLRAEGPPLPVYVGMRCWAPFVADTLARMAGDGVRHALALVLAPHRAEASWERYHAAVADGCAALGPHAPAITWTGAWHAHPGFIDAMAARTRAALARLGSDDPVALVFTAHSIPVDGAAGYVAALATSARLVAEVVGVRAWTLAYQSRSGAPSERWLEPDVNDVLRTLAARGGRAVALVPIGFVCDHVEVLYDLDVEARATAAAAGIRLERAATANDHPAFVHMLADVVRAGAAAP
jgi:ferrochelatase